jgi:hypothetical protein
VTVQLELVTVQLELVTVQLELVTVRLLKTWFLLDKNQPKTTKTIKIVKQQQKNKKDDAVFFDFYF